MGHRWILQKDAARSGLLELAHQAVHVQRPAIPGVRVHYDGNRDCRTYAAGVVDGLGRPHKTVVGHPKERGRGAVSGLEHRPKAHRLHHPGTQGIVHAGNHHGAPAPDVPCQCHGMPFPTNYLSIWGSSRWKCAFPVRPGSKKIHQGLNFWLHCSLKDRRVSPSRTTMKGQTHQDDSAESAYKAMGSLFFSCMRGDQILGRTQRHVRPNGPLSAIWWLCAASTGMRRDSHIDLYKHGLL